MWSQPLDDSGTTIQTYEIYRSTSSDGEFTFLAVCYTNSYTDKNVSNGNTYYYKVKAVNEFGSSDFSDQVFAKLDFTESTTTTSTTTTTTTTTPSKLFSISGFIFTPMVGLSVLVILTWIGIQIKKRRLN